MTTRYCNWRVEVPNGHNYVFTEDEIRDNPEFFRIDMEPEKPKYLKRADGSLITEPEEGTEVIFIEDAICYENGFEITKEIKYERCYSFLTGVKMGHCFLPEDKHLAEKKAKMLSKQLEIQYEIDRLNADEGWDGEDNETCRTKDNYSICFCENGNINWVFQNKKDILNIPNNKLMSNDTANYIITKYSQDELKQFLGIII